MNSAATTTYSGSIKGALALSITGSGTLTLKKANTWSGATIVSAGTLKEGIANTLPTTTVLTVTGTGTLDLGGFAQTVAGLADGGVSTGIITDSGAAAIFTVSNSTANSFSGLLTGALALTKTGAGTLTLSHANTWSGAITISAGTLQDGVANALPTSSAMTLSSTGTFDLGGFAQQIAGLTAATTNTVTDSGASATLTVNNAAANTISALIGGALALTKTGAGTLTLGHTNTYTGATVVSAGALSIPADADLGTVPGSATPSSLTLNGGTLITTATFTLNANRGISIGASGGIIDVASGTLSYNGIAAGAGGFTANGAGTLLLGGANTWSGVTIVSAGTLKDGVANALPTGTTLTVEGTGKFDLGGFAQQVGGLSDGGVSTGTVTDSGAAAIFTLKSAAVNSYSGLISGALALTRTGAGTLTLSHTNTYTGVTLISGGVLSVSADANLGTAPASATAGFLTLNGGTLATTATFTLNTKRGISFGASGGTIDVASGTRLIYSGIAAGAGSCTKTDAGTLILGGANTFTGATTVSAGTLTISADNNLALRRRGHSWGVDLQWRYPGNHGHVHPQR